jgi:hypothetical protein
MLAEDREPWAMGWNTFGVQEKRMRRMLLTRDNGSNPFRSERHTAGLRDSEGSSSTTKW